MKKTIPNQFILLGLAHRRNFVTTDPLPIDIASDGSHIDCSFDDSGEEDTRASDYLSDVLASILTEDGSRPALRAVEVEGIKLVSLQKILIHH